MWKGLWIVLVQYQNLKLENNRDAITLAQVVEWSWIFMYLSRSKLEYDLVRTKVHGEERLPSFFVVF